MTPGGIRLPMAAAGSEPGPTPAFHRIAVVGLGAVGGSVAMAVRRAWPRSLVIGVDSHDAVESAVRLHAIDVGAADLSIAAEADLVILAGSQADNAAVIPFLAEAIAGRAVILALGGPATPVGEPVWPASRLAFAVAQPGAGRHGGGILAARADLFQEQRWAVTPVTGDPSVSGGICDFIRAIGGEPVVAASPRSGPPPA